MHQQFQTAIRAEPSDHLHWQAYADWMAEQGDPRGEFMQVQLALAGAAGPRGGPADAATHDYHPKLGSFLTRQSLLLRQEELLSEHARDILGPLAALQPAAPGGQGECVANFYRGWLGELTLLEAPHTLERMLQAGPWLPFLQRLNLWFDPRRTPASADRYAEIFAEHPDVQLPIRELVVGTQRMAQTGERTGPRGGASTALLASRAAGLTALRAYGERVDLAALARLPAPHLEELVVQTRGPIPWDAVASRPRPNLVVLDLVALRTDDHPLPDAAGLRTLACSPHFPRLRRLSLRNHRIDDACCAALAESGIFRRLKVLDLRSNEITDAGVLALQAPGSGYESVSFDLSGNRCLRADE